MSPTSTLDPTNTTDAITGKAVGDFFRIVQPSQGIAGINSAIDALQSTGGKIKLLAGTYSGSVGVLIESNIILEGEGIATIINRDSGNDIFSNSSSYSNSVVKDISCDQIARTGTSPDQLQFKVVNCFVGGKYVNDDVDQTVNIVKVGAGLHYEKISDVYDRFNSVDLDSSPQGVRWQIHVYGHILENSLLGFTKNRIDIIGHNAIIELNSTNKNDIFRFLDQSNDRYGPGLDILIKDIHFLRTGTMNAWDFPCASIETDYATFENVTFENATKSPSTFDQRNETTGGDNVNGARRHGLVITATKFGDDCKLRLINCKGIGSQYGFQNTRGIYIIGGSPTLQNCTGIGGGIGEYGHGIIIHRYASPRMFDCVGVGSKWSFKGACGIRFQTAGNAELHNCVGTGGNGLRYISNGEVEGEVEIQALSSLAQESHGISFNTGESLARLYNCVGYNGAGANSHGLHCTSKNKPKIYGGYFGVQDRTENIVFQKDAGQNYQTYTINSDSLNAQTPYRINNVVISKLSGMSSVPVGTFLRVETDEPAPKMIIDDEACDNTINSIYLVNYSPQNIGHGIGLKISFVDGSGSEVTVPDGAIWITFTFIYNSLASQACRLDGESSPLLKHVHIKSNTRSHCLYLGQSLGDYKIISSIIECSDSTKEAIESNSTMGNINIFDTQIKGQLNDVSSFTSKTELLDSSNYSL